MKFFQLIYIFSMALFVVSCQQPIASMPQLSKDEIRAEEISQQRMVDEINSRGGKPKAWRNHKNMRKQFENVGERIEKAGAEICRELHLQKNGCYYYFEMNRSDEINSRADGKNIIIYTGMMRFVENDDELAAVMGHELAHNLMGHVGAQKKNATLGMLLGAAMDAAAASQGISTYGEITQAGTEIGMLKYSVDYEKEADYVGLYVMARAGYDIKRAPVFWRRMSIENPQEIYASVTHPSNAERFVALQKAVAEIEFKRGRHIPLLPDIKDAVKN